jgi:TRAP-type C4-dicarboxylate transport system substrate-binding protein
MFDFRSGVRHAVAACVLALPMSPAGADNHVPIQVIGGLGGINQYIKLEEPFWNSEIERVSGGRIKARIRPFDRAGLPGSEMLRLMQSGVVPFGTALISLVGADEPEFGAMDLPALNPDVSTLRKSVTAFRPLFTRLLKERYDVELLGIYTYPAQVVYCAKPFSALTDLAGRRVRTSSIAQFEFMTALGAIPVNTPFSQTVGAITKGVVDCAVTGTLSGNEIGLSEVTTHLHAMAINWGVSVFGASAYTWKRLPPDVQDTLRTAVGDLETRIWAAADRETMNGIACNIGSQSCIGGRRGKMKLVEISSADEATRRRMLIEVSLPRWLERCGRGCIASWNATIAPVVNLYIRQDSTISLLPVGDP